MVVIIGLESVLVWVWVMGCGYPCFQGGLCLSVSVADECATGSVFLIWCLVPRAGKIMIFGPARLVFDGDGGREDVGGMAVYVLYY